MVGGLPSQATCFAAVFLAQILTDLTRYTTVFINISDCLPRYITHLTSPHHSPLTTHRLFQIVFMCANGPLAWSVLAFNHALIFHSWQHITSLVIHTSPMLLTYGIRWHGNIDGRYEGPLEVAA